MIGKAVLFAPCEFDVTADLRNADLGMAGKAFSLADIPCRGSYVRSGHPVLTVLTGGKNDEDCLRLLLRASASVFNLLLESRNMGRVTS